MPVIEEREIQVPVASSRDLLGHFISLWAKCPEKSPLITWREKMMIEKALFWDNMVVKEM
ncbi:MAG: hypothetical protein HY731_08360 [Candidatus Tectomicrobia bacterium]|nr:hypothetical protein [Candidatus Tectomicrobia bacterium]